MLITTVGIHDTKEEAFESQYSFYNKTETALNKIGLHMLKNFNDGSTCTKLKNGQYLAKWNSGIDHSEEIFDLLHRLRIALGV
jgi:hypothetical protein